MLLEADPASLYLIFAPTMQVRSRESHTRGATYGRTVQWDWLKLIFSEWKKVLNFLSRVALVLGMRIPIEVWRENTERKFNDQIQIVDLAHYLLALTKRPNTRSTRGGAGRLSSQWRRRARNRPVQKSSMISAWANGESGNLLSRCSPKRRIQYEW